MLKKKLIELVKSILAVVVDASVALLLLAIIFDGISRYCWRHSVFIYYFGQDLMVSTLLLILVINLKAIPKLIVEGLFILSLCQIIDELLQLGSIDYPLKELAMILIGIGTIWRIRKLIKKG